MPSKGTTNSRGYGWAHQQARAAHLKAATPDQPCTRCRQPLGTTDPRQLHLDHADTRTTYQGLAHARCNTDAGRRTRWQAHHQAQQSTHKQSRNW